MKLPLNGITVLEFSQYLAGPYAGLRLADLGATVIKIERPGTGDACRGLVTKNLTVDGDSLVFHTINRNKQSFTADLKNTDDLARVKKLIQTADVMTHNFRPGVMEKIGLDYASVKTLHPTIIYGEVTGYGKQGPWQDKPGQDLLAQARSGLTWLTGNGDANGNGPPVPFGVSVADMLCGTHLAQGLLAALVRRQRHGIGAHVEVSLLESLIDFQFEGLTTWLNNGQQSPQRSSVANAHAFLGAPYGIYETADGHIAIGMGDFSLLADLIECPELQKYSSPEQLFSRRDDIKHVLANHLAGQTTDYWLRRLEPADYWCADVFTYAKLLNHAAWKTLQMQQHVKRDGSDNKDVSVTTTRCPIRIDQQRIFSDVAAPTLGNANARVMQELAAHD